MYVHNVPTEYATLLPNGPHEIYLSGLDLVPSFMTGARGRGPLDEQSSSYQLTAEVCYPRTCHGACTATGGREVSVHVSGHYHLL
jgi:hypothetical protein